MFFLYSFETFKYVYNYNFNLQGSLINKQLTCKKKQVLVSAYYD